MALYAWILASGGKLAANLTGNTLIVLLHGNKSQQRNADHTAKWITRHWAVTQAINLVLCPSPGWPVIGHLS
jgi:hypothetical protein